MSCLSVILVCALLIFSLYTGVLRFNYPDKERFPVQGIDVSHHQKSIDWLKLQNKNIRFVFIKATEGSDFKDRLFLRNWQQAKHAGFAVGAYHFFTLCKSGMAQAKNFIDTVPNEANTMPPVVDLEFGGNCHVLPSRKDFLKELNEFISEIERVYCRSPILYITYEFYDLYLKGYLEEYKIWIRDIYRYPQIQNRKRWSFWQYSNRGKLDGIDTFVDLNVFNGDESQFDALFQCAFARVNE